MNIISLISILIFQYQLLSTILINNKLFLINAYSFGASVSNNNINNNGPSWNRPGCHKLGHTREISIAGCVKFNLSTNACRGYCMSYSIPAMTEEHEIVNSYTKKPDKIYQITTTEDPHNQHSIIYRYSGYDLMTENLDKFINKTATATTTTTTTKASILPPESGNNEKQQQEVLQLSGGAPLIGNADPLRRDIVSVSQCCNMMETEDVIINLRCGFNETRRLVFKSAKTCECFFCKHI